MSKQEEKMSIVALLDANARLRSENAMLAEKLKKEEEKGKDASTRAFAWQIVAEAADGEDMYGSAFFIALRIVKKDKSIVGNPLHAWYRQRRFEAFQKYSEELVRKAREENGGQS